MTELEDVGSAEQREIMVFCTMMTCVGYVPQCTREPEALPVSEALGPFHEGGPHIQYFGLDLLFCFVSMFFTFPSHLSYMY